MEGNRRKETHEEDRTGKKKHIGHTDRGSDTEHWKKRERQSGRQRERRKARKIQRKRRTERHREREGKKGYRGEGTYVERQKGRLRRARGKKQSGKLREKRCWDGG